MVNSQSPDFIFLITSKKLRDWFSIIIISMKWRSTRFTRFTQQIVYTYSTSELTLKLHIYYIPLLSVGIWAVVYI